MANRKKRSDGSSWDEIKTHIWPSTATMEGAKTASEMGAGGALIVALFTAAIAGWTAYSGKSFAGLSPWSLLDAVAFTLMALGMRMRYRSAAWLALPWYLAGQTSVIYETGELANPIMLILITAYLINGVRGTTAIHRLRTREVSKQ